MTYASNYTNKATIFDSGDTIAGDHVKAIYDELGARSLASVPPMAIGRYYNGMASGAAVVTSTSWAIDTLCAYWFELPQEGTLDQFACRIITTGASGTLRLGLYEPDDTASGLPGTLIVSHTGTIPTDSAGVQTISISQAVTRRGVWAVVQTGTTVSGTRSAAYDRWQSLGRFSSTDASPVTCMSASRADSALGSLAGTSWSSSGNVPHSLWVRYSA